MVPGQPQRIVLHRLDGSLIPPLSLWSTFARETERSWQHGEKVAIPGIGHTCLEPRQSCPPLHAGRNNCSVRFPPKGVIVRQASGAAHGWPVYLHDVRGGIAAQGKSAAGQENPAPNYRAAFQAMDCDR